MNSSTRRPIIESYGRAYDMLIAALMRYPQEMWQWRPGPGKWSIHEIIVHIADSEANSFVRCRRLIAEPGSGVYGYDENKWAKALDYHGQSTDDALELFKWLRYTTYQLIKTLPEDTWQNATVEHSDSGTLTMEQWLTTYEEHIPIHIRQMERNYQAWLERKE